jgi:hypothetical protein
MGGIGRKKNYRRENQNSLESKNAIFPIFKVISYKKNYSHKLKENYFSHK